MFAGVFLAMVSTDSQLPPSLVETEAVKSEFAAAIEIVCALGGVKPQKSVNGHSGSFRS